MKELKKGIGMVYNTDKPKHAGDGIASGLGNVLKGTGAGIAAWGAFTYAGAKSEGLKGGLKGFGAGAIAGVSLAAAGVGTGAYQIGRGVYNTPNAIKKSTEGMEWDPEKEEYYIYKLNDEASKVLETSEEQFLENYEKENGKFIGF
jgi:hypothetical protein